MTFQGLYKAPSMQAVFGRSPRAPATKESGDVDSCVIISSQFLMGCCLQGCVLVCLGTGIDIQAFNKSLIRHSEGLNKAVVGS